MHGTDFVRDAVRADKVAVAILAADASPTQQQKLIPLLEARAVPFHLLLSREQLGQALGRSPVSAIGVTNRGFARRLGELAAALPSLQD